MNKKIILLLQLIKKNGNIDNLVGNELTYSDVASMVSSLLDDGFIEFSDKGVHVTISGEIFMSSINKELKRKNIEKFISPQDEYLFEAKNDLFDIYLPDLKSIK